MNEGPGDPRQELQLANHAKRRILTYIEKYMSYNM